MKNSAPLKILLLSKAMRNITLSLSSGVLLSLAYLVPALWFLGFFALVPLFFVLRNTKTFRARFFFSFIVGLIYFGSVFIFLFDAYPITWAYIEGRWISIIFITFTWVITTILFSFFIGLWGIFSAYISLHLKVISITAVAALWVLLEWIRAFSFSLVWWNTSALVGPHWTYGAVGYSLAESPLLLSLSSLGGVYLLSFVIVFFNGLFFTFVNTQKKTKKTYGVLLAFICILLVVSFISYTQSDAQASRAKTIRVASIHTTFGPDYFLSSPEAEPVKNIIIMNLFDQIIFENEHPNLIILPENTGYLESLSEIGKKKLLSRVSKDKDIMIIDSHRERRASDNDTSILEFETKTEGPQTYVKKLLVPGAEYLPKFVEYVGNVFLKKNWQLPFKEQVAFTKGGEMSIGTLGDLKVGALFCSEAFTPSLYRETVNLGANLLVNSASHSLLHDSKTIYSQVVKFSKVRAAENNRYYIQAGNVVPSFVITNHGRMIAETSREKEAILYSDVLLLKQKTLATKIGDTWILLFFLIYISGMILTIRGKRTQILKEK